MTPAPFGILGIVNVTPDSFSDGGTYDVPDAAIAHALTLLTQGAHILDIGGESTRPGATPVPQERECARVLPVIQGILAHAPKAIISVDTYHADTALAALNAGAHIINDVSACAFDPFLLDVLLQYTPGYILMYSQNILGTHKDFRDTPHIIDTVIAFFEAGLTRLVKAGLPESHIVLDPGVGFGKRHGETLINSQNFQLCHSERGEESRVWALLRRIDRIVALGRPVCVGVSRKSFLGHLCGEPAPQKRDAASHAATALLAARGVSLHRVHDVAGAAQALAVAQALTDR